MEERFTYDRLNRQTAIPVVGLSHRSSRVAPMAAAAMRQPCGGPLGVFAVVEQRDGYRPEVRYAFKDHLGSWTTVADAYGQVLAEQSFDAWGNPRNPDTWLNYSAAAAVAPLFDRGYTGHEHLAEFGLINMNGRMYDPVMSSFLSVDNYVQNPDFSQNFNRYAYCYNNPLKYTDPDGEWIQILIGAVIGGVTNLACNWGRIDTFGEGLAYFGIGAAAGALGAATCGAAAGVFGTVGFAGASLTGAAGGFASGFTAGAGNAWMQGSNFGQGLWAGVKSGGKGAAMGGLTSGVMGGITAVRHGGNFWTGKGAIFEYSVSGNASTKFDQKYYNDNVDKYEASLKKGAKDLLDFEVGDINVDRLTTGLDSPDADLMAKIKDTYFINKKGFYGKCAGGESYGFTMQTTVFGHSEAHISPGVVDGFLFEYNKGFFHATLGHELTHAYHIFKGLHVSQTGPSEWAAQDYTKAVLNYYKDYSAARSITVHSYDDGWKVPYKYLFSRLRYD